MFRLVLCLFLLCLADTSLAQPTSGKISPSETKHVNQIARRFAQQLRLTKDFAPITRELFVTDFIERSLKTDYSVWLFLDPKFARTLPKQELREIYVLLSNWSYLSSLYYFSLHSSTSNAEIADREVLPKEVVKVISRNKTLKVFVDSGGTTSEDEDKEWVVDSKKELRPMKSTLIKALPLLRKAAIKRGAGTTKAWKETMSDFGNRFKYYKPWITECTQNCHGYPDGSRFFIVNAELFQLQVVKVGKRMRILSAFFYYD